MWTSARDVLDRAGHKCPCGRRAVTVYWWSRTNGDALCQGCYNIREAAVNEQMGEAVRKLLAGGI